MNELDDELPVPVPEDESKTQIKNKETLPDQPSIQPTKESHLWLYGIGIFIILLFILGIISYYYRPKSKSVSNASPSPILSPPSQSAVIRQKMEFAPVANHHISISPNGRWLTYINSENYPQIVLYNLNSQQTYTFPITDSTFLNDNLAVWSIDDSYLYTNTLTNLNKPNAIDLNTTPPSQTAVSQYESTNCSDCQTSNPSSSVLLSSINASGVSNQTKLVFNMDQMAYDANQNVVYWGDWSDGQFIIRQTNLKSGITRNQVTQTPIADSSTISLISMRLSKDGTELIYGLSFSRRGQYLAKWYYLDLNQNPKNPISILNLDPQISSSLVWDSQGMYIYGFDTSGQLVKLNKFTN
jgi:hypothetical protein